MTMQLRCTTEFEIRFLAKRHYCRKPGDDFIYWRGGVVVYRCGFAAPHGIVSQRRNRFNVDQPTVVRQIQRLQKLETVSYTMDKIIGGARDNAYLPKFLAGDRILLVVHGEVVAGVNLENIKASDVTVQGHSISLRLPPAEVFNTRIDNAKSRVYSRDTGLFTSPDPNLESEVRQEAERQLQQSAVVDGILKSADQNARNTVSGMLTGLGFTQVSLQ